MATSNGNASCNAKPLGKLSPEHTALFVCDIQERNRPLITGMPSVIDTARRLVRGANTLGLPVLVSESHYEEQRNVVPEIKELLNDNTPIVVKTAFSMVVEETVEFLKRHSAIQQGYEVHLAVDGVSSQRPYDRAVGLHRLSQSGVLLCTSEMALYQLASDCKHPKFSDISALCLEVRPDYLGVPGVMGATSL